MRQRSIWLKVLLINGREKIGIKNLKAPKVFIDYSQTIDDVYQILKDYKSKKKRNELIVFGNIVEDTEANKKLNPIVTQLFIWVHITILFQIA